MRKATRLKVQRELALNAMNQPLRGVKTIIVANPKGWSGKTPLGIMLASAFGIEGGKRPIILDNNPTGNLRVRLAQCYPSSLTIDDLAANLEVVKDSPIKVNDFITWQQVNKFAAIPAKARKIVYDDQGRAHLDRPTISVPEVLGVWEASAFYHDLIIADSGNNNADDPWKGMLQRADVLIVPLRWQADYCQAAVTMLETLHETGYSALARSAIIVATSPMAANKDIERSYSAFFRDNGFTLHTIPVDPHLQTNEAILWPQLKQDTRDHVLRLCGDIATRLVER